jgi:hypothetical protein
VEGPVEIAVRVDEDELGHGGKRDRTRQRVTSNRGIL